MSLFQLSDAPPFHIPCYVNGISAPGQAQYANVVTTRKSSYGLGHAFGAGRPEVEGGRNDDHMDDETDSHCILRATLVSAYNFRADVPATQVSDGERASISLVCYDFLLTFEYEYEFLWRRKWTGATWLFIVNRYLMLAATIAQSVPFSAQMLQPVFPAILLHSFQLTNRRPAFSALRVLALLGRAYIPAGCVFLLGLVPVAISLYQNMAATYHYMDVPVLGQLCSFTINISPALQFHCTRFSALLDWKLKLLVVTLVAVLTSIATDIAAIVTTWIKTYRHVREAASLGVNVGFSATCLHYGTLYFLVIVVLHLANLLLLIVPSFRTANPMTTFTEILPNVVLSRFLINLRQVENGETSHMSHFSRFSAPSFRVPTLPDIIGNLGEPLVNGDHDPIDEDAGDSTVREGYSAGISNIEDKKATSDSMGTADSGVEVQKDSA
ncbi:hypothetical protein NM688_g903 [Phlebia brevispora]|uniref:Uncharacterized protein n=1 Tax=Phlebia brevispora TaxID=194682 RepID=A0ACC1TCQ2_9APHY|nr:hypothetical protein NM688_g903 [Phlebia brevispora]